MKVTDIFGSNVQPKKVMQSAIQDWLCVTCGYHNRFTRQCLDCGKEAPENE